jgi:hypothetical protein
MFALTLMKNRVKFIHIGVNWIELYLHGKSSETYAFLNSFHETTDLAHSITKLHFLDYTIS